MNEDRLKVPATTALMLSELTDHFELNFSEEIVCCAGADGGRANDGTVVAVLRHGVKISKGAGFEPGDLEISA